MNTLITQTDSFLSLGLALQNMHPITILSVFLLTLARIAPIVSVAPFLGAKNVRATIKMLFAVAFTALFFSQNLVLIREDIPYNYVFIGYFCKELIIGFIMGFIVALPFYIATSTGALIDHSRGSSALQVTDPSTTAQTSSIGLLNNAVLLVVFFSVGGPLLFFNAVADSYQVIPVDGLIGSTFFQMGSSFWSQMLGFFSKFMDITVRLAAPPIIAMLLTDLFLGIANRLATQVQVVFLGIPLKSWVGIALMTAAWGLIIQVMGKESIQWIKSLQKAITSIEPSVIK
jgi:type III secretion protein T